ncbi:MAG: protein kinase [Cyanobacteria bacterium]|nr:protein kinase [Cyanobacteriota bacterium]
MTGEETRCPRCDGMIDNQGASSLTQWIFRCRCDNSLVQEVVEDSTAPSICLKCRKRIPDGRAGSFTQWIFRANSCSCTQSVIVPGLLPESAAERSAIRRRRRAEGTDDSQLPRAPTAVRTAKTLDEPPIAEPDGHDVIEFPPGRFPSERYRPLSRLGAGAAGEVYLCHDVLLSKRVAVKVLHELTKDQYISFQNEARSTSTLRHPGIITILDFGVTESGIPYMVMECFVGTSLEKKLKENGPLPWAAVVELALILCDALQSAHEKGIFHRDLKPSNILLSGDSHLQSNIRLIDFGIARYSPSQQTTGQGKTLVGTPLYMSPDQVSGLTFDVRSEVYCLGCVLFELLTGKPPFVGSSALETLAMHAQMVPDTVSAHVDVPDEIDKLVARCLEKEPGRRYQSMQEVTDELRTIDTKSYSSTPPSLPSNESSPVARSGVGLRIAAGLLLIASLVVGALFIWYSERMKSEGNGVDYRASARAAIKSGDLRKAEKLYALGADDAEKKGNAHEIVEDLNGLCSVQLNLGRLDGAAQSLARAWRTIDNNRHQEELSADLVGLRRALIDRMLEVANRAADNKKFDLSEKLFQESLKRNKDDIDDFTQRPKLYAAYLAMLKNQGRVEEAQKVTRESDAFFGKRRDPYYDANEILRLQKRGSELLTAGKYKEADELLEQAYRLSKSMQMQPFINFIRSRLAVVKLALGRVQDCEDLSRQILSESKVQGERDDAERLMAECAYKKKRYAEAEPLLQRVLAQTSLKNPALEFIRQTAKTELFICLWKQKKFDKADLLFDSILAESENQAQFGFLNQVGDELFESRPSQAERAYRKGLKLCEKLHLQPAEKITAQHKVIRVLTKEGKLKEAKTLALQVLPDLQREEGHVERASQIYCDLGTLFLTLKLHDQFKECMKMSLDCLQRNPLNSFDSLGILHRIYQSYEALGMLDNAAGCLDMKTNLCGKDYPDNIIGSRNALGDKYFFRHMYVEAEEQYKKAISFFESPQGQSASPGSKNYSLLALAATYTRMGRYRESQRILDGITKLDGDQRNVFLFRNAYNLQMSFRADEALSSMAKLPNSLDKVAVQCLMLIQLGRFEQANVLLGKTLQQSQKIT